MAPRMEPVVPKDEGALEAAISAAQSNVVASKFRTDGPAPKPAVRPTLPLSYGESHLLLLVRDPQTLFAAWDMSPLMVESLKARLGRRAFAVSTLTLRLTRAGGGTDVVHVSKKVRSRYLKIDGGPSFVGEIGFTTPTGRFEQVARSAPCFVPMGAARRSESLEAGQATVRGYREAFRPARREAMTSSPGDVVARAGAGPLNEGGSSPSDSPSPGASAVSRATPTPTPSPKTSGPTTSGSATPRFAATSVLGGASDLYRR